MPERMPSSGLTGAKYRLQEKHCFLPFFTSLLQWYAVLWCIFAFINICMIPGFVIFLVLELLVEVKPNTTTANNTSHQPTNKQTNK